MSSLEEHLRAVEEGLSIARDVYRGGAVVEFVPGSEALWDAVQPVLLLPEVASWLEVDFRPPSGESYYLSSASLREAYPALYVEPAGGVAGYYAAWNAQRAAKGLWQEISRGGLDAGMNALVELGGMSPVAYVCLGSEAVLPLAGREDLEVRLRLHRA